MPPTTPRMPRTPPGRRNPPLIHGPRPVSVAWSVAVGTAFAALYLALTPTVSGNKDASEFTLVLALAGVAHPTGYPLYTLLGHGFVLLLHELGVSWTFAANAWSALGAATAMGLFHALACRIVPTHVSARARRMLALLATLVAGLNPAWVLDAVMAEVYSWHLAWVCGACLATLAILRALADPRGGTTTVGNDPPPRPLQPLAAGWGLLAGIGLAHHATAVLCIVPLSAVIVVALLRARRWSASLALLAFGAALVPLASYGFVVYRAWHPAVFQWQTLQPSLASVIAHLTGAEYRDLIGRFAPSEMQRELFRSFIYPVLVPGLAGLAWATLRARALVERLALGGVTAAAGLQTAYGFLYGVADPSSYFLPGMALGLLTLPLAGGWLRRRPRASSVAGVLAVAGLLALGAWWIPLGMGVRAEVVAIEERVRGLWRSIEAAEGIVLWRDDMLPMLRGYQLLDGERAGLYVQDPYALTWPGPRREFTARFGFDPLEGMGTLTTGDLGRIAGNISRQTPLPVIVFDVSRRTAEPLEKPSAPAESLAAVARPGTR